VRLYINDVAVRDGFQIEKAFVPTQTKVELVNQLSRTGLHKIEVTSFVSPKAVPALADADRRAGRIDRVPGVIYVALVPEHPRRQNAAAVREEGRRGECGDLRLGDAQPREHQPHPRGVARESSRRW
jgi:hydroxymethylglutaryl-CoA lyase